MKTLIQYPALEGYDTRRICPGDLISLQGLLERCTDYFTLVSGSPAGTDAAESLLEEHPPGKIATDKLVLGVYYQSQKLIAVLDAIQDYPAQAAWWLGLLLIDPAYRGQGLGHEIYQSFEHWLITQRTQGIWLGVLEDNHAAHRFWKSVGFDEYERQSARQFGSCTHTVITMFKKFIGEQVDRDSTEPGNTAIR